MHHFRNIDCPNWTHGSYCNVGQRSLGGIGNNADCHKAKTICRGDASDNVGFHIDS
jgi:hypothetical protein